MSTLAGNAYHPINGSTEKIWEGFSWPCLFFGCFWCIYKGMWRWGIITFILAFCSFGISWLIFPFFANEYYAKSLLERGYLSEDQWNERTRASRGTNKPDSNSHAASSVADELAKLAALKAQGVLTDEEFNREKRQILSHAQEAAPANTKPTKRLSTATVILIFVGILGLFGWLSNSGKPKPLRESSNEPSGSSQTTVEPPNGFRSIKWGSSPSASLKKYSGPTSDGITMYVPASSKALSSLFETPIAEELYSFANGKFYSGSAWFDGPANFEKVKAVLLKTYGQPSFANEKLSLWKWKWLGNKIEVHLSYQSKFSRTTVTFLNDAI